MAVVPKLKIDESMNRKKLIDELEREAERLHNATRTDIPFLSPVHNLLRTRLPFYYDWSTYPKTPTIHRVGVLGFLVSFLFFTILQFAIPNLFIPVPQKVKASSIEETQKRQASLKVFKNPDGTISNKFYVTPVHYKDESGNWQDIDTKIENLEGDNLKITKAPFKLDFSKNSKQPLTFKVDNNQIIVHPDNSIKNSKASIAGNIATYTNIYDNTDIERIVQTTGIKQNFILKSPGHPTTFTEKISGSLAPSLDSNGSINFKDNQGNIITNSPRPDIEDAKGVKKAGTYVLSGDILMINLPSLDGLTYPIKVDPTIALNTAQIQTGTPTNVDTSANPVALSTLSTSPNFYNDNGTLINLMDPEGAGSVSKINSIAWETSGAGVTTQPGNDTVKFQVSPNNDTNFVGPDGAAGTYFTTATGHSATANIQGRYAKLKSYFNINPSAMTTMNTPSVTTEHAFDSMVVQLPDGKYRLYYRWISGSPAFSQIAYKDTSDTNPPNGSNLGSQNLLGVGSSSTDQAGGSNIVQLPDGKYRLYYGYSNGTGWQLAYRDTSDTNYPTSSNIGTQNLLNVNDGTASNQAFKPSVMILPDGKYRLYYDYYGGTYWQLAYRDTTDTNLPTSSNLGSQTLTGVGSSTSDTAIGQSIVQLPNSKYRIYYTYGDGTYSQLAYRDTTDTNLPSSSNLGSRISTGIGTGASDQATYIYPFQLSAGQYRMYHSYYNGTNWQLAYRDIDYSTSPSLYSVTVTYSRLSTGDIAGGDLVIGSDVAINYTLTGDHQGANGYKSITVQNGSTLNIQPNDTTDGAIIDVNVSGGTNLVWVTGTNSQIIPIGYGGSPSGKGVTINAKDITLDANTKINADVQGYANRTGPGIGADGGRTLSGYNYTYYSGGGAGYGNNGGAGNNGAAGGTSYGSAAAPTDLGSSGGRGVDSSGNLVNSTSGIGGGAIKLATSNNITIGSGASISVNGGAGSTSSSGGGGGSGGSIWLSANNITNSGTISANGGNGGGSGNTAGGGGGGGRIAIIYTGTKSMTVAPSVNYGTGANNGVVGSLLYQGPSDLISVFGFSNQSSQVDGTSPIKTSGSVAFGEAIYLNFWYKVNQGNSASFTPFVEVEPANQAFVTTEPELILNTNYFRGSQITTNSGIYKATVSVSGLADGTYHWRARFIDAVGNLGPWSSYGGNSDGSPPGTPADSDFQVGGSATGSGYPDLALGLASNLIVTQSPLNFTQNNINLSGVYTAIFGNNVSINSPGGTLTLGNGTNLTLGTSATLNVKTLTLAAAGSANTITLGSGTVKTTDPTTLN
ncbi:hypothetical protein COS74_03660, partial [bacterium CG06_land_8_20_14_3_00_33_50]